MCLIRNKPSATDNDFSKTVGNGGEQMILSNFSIKSGEGIVFVSEYRWDIEVNISYFSQIFMCHIEHALNF